MYCRLALVGVPVMVLKMPIEADRLLLGPSSTGFIWKKWTVRKLKIYCLVCFMFKRGWGVELVRNGLLKFSLIRGQS